MNWFFSIVRIAGSQFPGASALVQLQAELDADALTKRVRKLEDPISFLHPDVPAVSKIIYEDLKAQNYSHLEFDDEFYTKYSRCLAALDSEGHIEKKHQLGRHLPFRIDVVDSSYIMYLCALFEDTEKMERLVEKVDTCKINEWLDGHQLSHELKLPLPVVQSCFTIYESKGYGICSQEIGRVSYCGHA